MATLIHDKAWLQVLTEEQLESELDELARKRKRLIERVRGSGFSPDSILNEDTILIEESLQVIFELARRERRKGVAMEVPR